MQMSTTKKVRLGLFFCIGALSCIGATVRPIVIQHGSPDIMYHFQDQYSWDTIDIFFATIAASLPVLNAAIPKGWRRRSHTIKGLRTLSATENGTDESGNQMTPWQFGRDGTVWEEPKEAPKESFHTKTEKRWDDAYVNGVKQSETVLDMVRTGSSEGISSASAGSLKGH